MSFATLWGTTETPETTEVSFPTFPVSNYNTHALRSSAPALRWPSPGPARPHIVRSPFEANDAAVAYLPTIDASRYNQHALEISGPIITYPYGDGPITEEKALSMLEDELTPKDQLRPIGTSTYDPSEVRKTLELLAKGDLTEEQQEDYKEDEGRLRIYEALKKQRPLSNEEQAVVDEIGRRIDEESKALVREDVEHARSKRGEIERQEGRHMALAAEKDAAERAAIAADIRYNAAKGAVRAAKAEEKDAAATLVSIRNSQEYKGLEDEKYLGWPWAVTDLDVEAFEKRLAKIRSVEQKVNTRLLDIQAEKARAKQERDDALAARQAALDVVRDREPQRLAAAAETVRARAMKPAVNPRFTMAANRQMPQLVDAIEVSKLPDAPEDKQSDYDFEVASQPGGAVDQFYKYNAISHGLSGDPKFISKEALRDEWKLYVQKNPALPKKAPWSGENRKNGLKLLMESSKIPSGFKMQVLRATGFA